jgi:hypothetical protein
MAKVTLIMEDGLDGSISLKMDCDPPIEKHIKATPAQNMGGWLMERIVEMSGGPLQDEEAEGDSSLSEEELEDTLAETNEGNEGQEEVQQEESG